MFIKLLSIYFKQFKISTFPLIISSSSINIHSHLYFTVIVIMVIVICLEFSARCFSHFLFIIIVIKTECPFLVDFI